MPSSPKNLNYGFTPKLFRLFSSMVQNHWYILQHKSPKLTVYITKLSGKYSRSRAHYTISFFLLTPDSPCWNECLLSLSYPVLSTCIASSLRIPDSKLIYLGHILRHPSSPESVLIFNPSYSLRTISSPFRRGAPRVHWPEWSLAEAFHRFTILNTSAPLLGQFNHEFYRFFTVVELKNFSAASMKQWYDTTKYLRVLLPLAENREQRVLLTPNTKWATKFGCAAADV